MTRNELATAIARRAGVSNDVARAAVEAVFGGAAAASEPGLIAAALAQGERVQLAGFGTFEARRRNARVGRNPHTQERITIPASVSPSFRPGSGLRQQVRSRDGLQAPAAGL